MFGKTDLNELRDFVIEIENYINNNVENLILGRIYMSFVYIFVSVLKKAYQIINKSKIFLEIKITEESIKKVQYKKGDLIKVTLPILVLKTCATEEETKKVRHREKGSWTAIEVNDVVMFIGVVYDDFYDCVFLQILKENSMYLVVKDDERIKNYADFLNKKFHKINYEK